MIPALLGMTKLLNWRVIAIVAAGAILFGGWYVAYRSSEKVAELKREVEIAHAGVDTVIVAGKTTTRIDTLRVVRRATKYDTIVRGDTVYQTYRDTLLVTLSNSGVVEFDTTIAGKLDFTGRVNYPSGLSELHFKFYPAPPPKKWRWFAGVGIGITRTQEPFVIGDISYRRFGLGVYAREQVVGGFVRLNF